tara:strand:- start:1263 stop:1817 length:555 start_codon:yes stop_codon:yes gene_type:complete
LKAICGISWEVNGLENIPDGPCIFAANHQGVWESFFLQTINIPTSSIIKRELLLIPFFGWALACLKPIHLRRSNKFKSLKTVINKGSKKLSNNTSLIIFPEGTRSLPENGLKNFSSSCGVLCVKNSVPVIPICHNSGLFWKNKKFNKEPGIIKVRIGPAIWGDNPKSVTKDVKDWIQSSFDKIH